jgi:dTDP-4-dehydrorhamnose reductase
MLVIDDSAAEKRHDVAENPARREELIRLNVKVPELLGRITKEKGILLIYISTGNIFKSRLIRLCL